MLKGNVLVIRKFLIDICKHILFYFVNWYLFNEFYNNIHSLHRVFQSVKIKAAINYRPVFKSR